VRLNELLGDHIQIFCANPRRDVPSGFLEGLTREPPGGSHFCQLGFCFKLDFHPPQKKAL
jgi:hypothetical protein